MQDSLHNCRANCDKHIKGLETKVHQMKKAKSGERDEIHKLIGQLFGMKSTNPFCSCFSIPAS